MVTDEAPPIPQYKRLADRLRSQILAGEFQPGERLPAELQLMEQYGVSRSTWREALRTLAAENLIVATRGVNGGTFVMEPSTQDIENYLQNSLSLLMRTQLSAEQIIEARIFLEVPAAGLAAERRTEDHLRLLKTSIDELRSGSGPQVWTANKLFHGTLLDATQNPLLRAFIAPIYTTLRTNILREYAESEFWDQVGCDHEDIFEAIRERDSAAAEKAMRHHLVSLEGTYVDLNRSKFEEDGQQRGPADK